MMYPTHLVAGYLVGYSSSLPILWVVIGAGLQDIIDKPIGALGIGGYHSIGHSGLMLVFLGIIGYHFGAKGIALWFGWASHLFLDAFHMILNGRPEDIVFLLWPFIGFGGNGEPGNPEEWIEFGEQYLWSNSFYAEILIWIIFIAVLIHEKRNEKEPVT